MNYTALLAYWRKELSDPTSTGHNWTPAEVEEQAIKQLVYGEITNLIEKRFEEIVDIDDDADMDALVNGFVERSE